MLLLKCNCLLLMCYIGIGICESKSPPKWPPCYTVQGQLQLPYAEIDEPFFAYYDETKSRSRVDYYGDMVITMQISGDGKKTFGESKKVAPMSTEAHLNEKKCFLVNGTKEAPVLPQAVLPDISNFTQLKTEYGSGNDVWQFIEKIGNKKNTYTLWVDESNHPVTCEMMGYDTLLGSHYDKYYLKYSKFTKEDKINDSIFALPKGIKECAGFPGPGDMEHRLTMNPMQEYMSHDHSHTDDMFNKFKKLHNKKYINDKDHSQRRYNFQNNVRFIHSKNRAGLGYTLALNHLADLHDSELKQMRGYQHYKTDKPSSARAFNIDDFDVRDVPDNLDWRLFGAVTPVKDQAVCGSCWSFGTAEHVEGAYFMKYGELKRLSQQELMDCSWGEGNNACDGGEDFRAYDWIKKHGLATEEAYGPYLAQDGYCHSKNVTATAFINDYVNVTSGSTQALKVALTNQGPISVAIDAALKDFSFYSNGVYYNPECGNTPDDLDHAVLAVGFGYMNGEGYWLVKNSWSTYWGNNGYVLMSSRNNNCGVATAATYVIIK